MLDEPKRKKIIALIANGSSRRMAAKYVRCAPSSINRAAAEDLQFAAQLATAEQSAEIDALRAIRAAFQKERYWRAAAWLLERKNPEDFARRPPTLFSGEDVFQVISQIVEILQQEIPEANCQRAIEKLEEILEVCRLEQTTPKFPQKTIPGDCPNFRVDENGTVPLSPLSASSDSPSPTTSTVPPEHPSSDLREVTSTTPAATPDQNAISAPHQ
jgi:hypothetical protein